MPRIIRTPQANEDALAIWEYIAQDSVSAAVAHMPMVFDSAASKGSSR